MNIKKEKTEEPKTEEFFIPKKFKCGRYSVSQHGHNNTDSIRLVYKSGGLFSEYIFLYIPEFGSKTSIHISREDGDSLLSVYDKLGSLKSVHVTKGGKEYLMYINFKTEAEIKKRICDFAENESIRVTAEINKISEPIFAIVIRHYYDGLSVGYSFMIKTTDANSKNIMEEYIDGEDHDFNVLLSCVSENKRDRYFSMDDTEFTDKMKRLMSEHVNKFGFELLVEEID